MEQEKLNKKLENIILKCQDLREKYGFDYRTKCEKQIDKFSKIIIEEDLTNHEDNENKTLAKQLCIMNDLEYEKD